MGPGTLNTAVVFPGQGSRSDTMRDDVAQHRPQLLAALEDALGPDVFQRAERETACAQPAIFCASLACYDRWRETSGDAPAFLAGHSLGEISALVAAGALDELCGLLLVVERGRLMQEACDAQPGGMLALIGPEARAVANAAPDFDLSLANDNAPEQTVVAGPRPALAAFETAIADRNVQRRALPVAGAFHSPLMRGAVAPFRRALSATPFTAPTVPVFSATSAAPFADVREQLAESLVAPVRWRETVLALRDAGAQNFVEPGPGRVLNGLVKRILRAAPAAEAVPAW